MSRFTTASIAASLTLVLSAPAALSQETAPETPDPAEICVEIAGVPTAEVPVSAEAQRDFFAQLAEARADCEAGAEAGDGASLFHSATIAQARRNHGEALEMYEAAAKAGVAAAYSRIGDYYNFGIANVRQDVDRALQNYRSGAEAGDPASEATLGMMYALGRGVPRDRDTAAELLRSASAKDYHFAQARLAGLLLADAPNDAEAVTEARALLGEAAKLGNTEALAQLPDLYARSVPGLEDDPTQRFRWTNRAAIAGIPSAIAARGVLYEFGIGISANPQRAAENYVAALETGEVSVDTFRQDANGRTPQWDRETALAFQRILQERGLYRGPLDAIVGFGTLSAARALADN